MFGRTRPLVAKVEMGRCPDGFWWWRLRGVDGLLVGHPETYGARALCHFQARGMADQLRVKLEFVYPLGK